MTYLNQFHKEAVERKLRKIAESMKSPMNSIDAANYMRRNLEKAKLMESMKQWVQCHEILSIVENKKTTPFEMVKKWSSVDKVLLPRGILPG